MLTPFFFGQTTGAFIKRKYYIVGHLLSFYFIIGHLLLLIHFFFFFVLSLPKPLVQYLFYPFFQVFIPFLLKQPTKKITSSHFLNFEIFSYPSSSVVKGVKKKIFIKEKKKKTKFPNRMILLQFRLILTQKILIFVKNCLHSLFIFPIYFGNV